jgi:uroporphyrinogen-III synthase
MWCVYVMGMERIAMSSENVNRGLAGLRLLSLESRRANQMAKLIESHGGVAVVAPSMREIPLQENSAALSFAENLFAGKFDAVIFLTGVGTRILFGAVESKYPRERLVEALSRLPVVARGPKPVAALREFGVPIAVVIPEPNTWREILRALDDHQPPMPLKGKRIALQEYGVSNQELIQGLEARGALVTPVPVYQWALPEDTEPLRRAIREIIDGKIDVLLITSANQVHNMMQLASQSGLEEAVRQGLLQTLVVSVGPISTEALLAHGIAPDMEPTHSKMGQLVYEAAERAKVLLNNKRAEFV